MVYAGQFRICISQFDGILDPSIFVIKLEVPDSDFLGAYIIVSCGSSKSEAGVSVLGRMRQLAPACLHGWEGGAAAKARDASAPCDTRVRTPGWSLFFSSVPDSSAAALNFILLLLELELQGESPGSLAVLNWTATAESKSELQLLN